MRHAKRSLIFVVCCAAFVICGCSKKSTEHTASGQNNENKPVAAAKPESKPAEKLGGKYEIRGEKKEGTNVSSVADKGFNDGDEQLNIEINWPITKSQFDELKEGQSTFKVRHVLGLDKLDLEPFGPKTRFRVVCKNGSARVTLDFAGYSDTELKTKSESGLK